MGRKLFCEWSPATYRISVAKCRMLRRLRDLQLRGVLARQKFDQPLPVVIYRHRSLIRPDTGRCGDAPAGEQGGQPLSGRAEGERHPDPAG